MFSHYKVEEQPSNKPKKSFNPQNGRSDDKGAVAIVKTSIGLSLARLRAIRISEKREGIGET